MCCHDAYSGGPGKAAWRLSQRQHKAPAAQGRPQDWPPKMSVLLWGVAAPELLLLGTEVLC